MIEEGERVHFTAYPNVKCFIRYSDGSCVGDSEIIGDPDYLIKPKSIRHFSAICSTDCTLFKMSMSSLENIKYNFGNIFKEFKKTSIKRF